MKPTAYPAVVLAVLLSAAGSFPERQDKQGEPTAAQIIEKSLLAFYYQGDDMKAKLTMELIDKSGGTRTRVMTLLRWDEGEGGDQKYFIYFHKPGDVRRMTFLVWKYPRKADDRWIFVPAVDLIRRIAADDERSSFVGSDFTYEDVSGRDVEGDTHSLLPEEKLGDADCYVIRSVPRTEVGYTRKLSWIDKESFLPLKEEYYDAQEQLFRVFTADRIEGVAVGEGAEKKTYPTIVKRTMKNVKTGHRTEVTYDSVSYDLSLQEKDFSERRMRRPPREWTK